jgi:general secretion pathway protein G
MLLNILARLMVLKKSHKQANDRGFTLTELMVVIVIIGLLATVVLINVLPSQDKAMIVKARADIATLEQAMEMYRLDMLRYPDAADGLQALKTAPAEATLAERYRPGGYIKSLPADPWGRPYQLAVPGKSGPFDVYSLGADGAPGGDGENADIYAGGS